MLKLCPWKKTVMKHNVLETSFSHDAQSAFNSTNEDVSIDFGNCSNYACPFYDESRSVWCRRVSLERGEE